MHHHGDRVEEVSVLVEADRVSYGGVVDVRLRRDHRDDGRDADARPGHDCGGLPAGRRKVPIREQQRKKQRDDGDGRHLEPESEPRHRLTEGERSRRDHEGLYRVLARKELRAE